MSRRNNWRRTPRGAATDGTAAAGPPATPDFIQQDTGTDFLQKDTVSGFLQKGT